jgi:hypothetical protein
MILVPLRGLEAGLGTNNPDIIQYYQRALGGKRPVNLDTPNTFNGHDITQGKCVVLKDISARPPAVPAATQEADEQPQPPSLTRHGPLEMPFFAGGAGLAMAGFSLGIPVLGWAGIVVLGIGGIGSVVKAASALSRTDEGDKPAAGKKSIQETPYIQKARKFLEEAGVKNGWRIINVGAVGVYGADIALAAARMGAHCRGYDLHDNWQSYYDGFDMEEFGGSAVAVLGEFSSGPRSRSKDIPDHSQDVVLILTGALADDLPESNPLEVMFEALRVVKPGGRIIAGSYDVDWLFSDYEARLDGLVEKAAVGWRGAQLHKVRIIDYAIGVKGRAVVYEVSFSAPSGPERAGTTATPHDDSGKGGIDFRALPIVTQPLGTVPLGGQPKMGTGTAPVALEKQWREIERMLQAGIRPSTDRIKEYVKAIEGQYNAETPRPIGGPGVPPSAEIDKVLSCIADILRQEEQECYSTEPALRQLLALLESGDPLGPGLEKVQPLPKEPKGKRE